MLNLLGLPVRLIFHEIKIGMVIAMVNGLYTHYTVYQPLPQWLGFHRNMPKAHFEGYIVMFPAQSLFSFIEACCTNFRKSVISTLLINPFHCLLLGCSRNEYEA